MIRRRVLQLFAGATAGGMVGAAGSAARQLPHGVITVGDFGAIGDGETDATQAIQAAIDACPEGGELHLVGGVFKCSSGLTVTRPITIRGSDGRNQNLPNAAAQSMLSFATDVEVGITVTANVRLKGIVVSGLGLGYSTGAAIDARNCSLVLEDVLIQAWETGIRVRSGYYNKLARVRVDYCRVAAEFDSCYNIGVSASAFLGRELAGARGIDLFNGSALTLTACSIESFRTSGIALYDRSSVNLFGTYFEGEGGAPGASCVLAGTGARVNAIGCQAYLTHGIESFVALEHRDTSGLHLFSRGNRITYPTDGQAVSVYALNGDDATAFVDVAGDNWDDSAGPECGYLGIGFDADAAAGQYRIVFPPGYADASSNVDTVRRPHGATAPPTVPAAASISLPFDWEIVSISGTTGIDSISAAGHSNRRVTLVFRHGLEITNGSNLRLSADFSASPEDTLTLISDGTNWYEIARSQQRGA